MTTAKQHRLDEPGLRLRVGDGLTDTGFAAARDLAGAINLANSENGGARVILAAAPSQAPMLRALVADPSIDWSRVQLFHMDEYIGLPSDHPAAFGNWLEHRLARVEPASFDRIRPGLDPTAELTRYADLLAKAPIDAVALGIGVNGHIAFNEPGALLDDPQQLRVIQLNQASRLQQVEEGLFATLDQVPTEAITLTVPALLRGRTLVVSVLGSHKAKALVAALTGPIGSACPATAIRQRPRVIVHVDAAAAELLPVP